MSAVKETTTGVTALRTCHNFHIRMWREWWWSYRPEGCHTVRLRSDICRCDSSRHFCVCRDKKKLYFWQEVRASPAVFVCEINTFFLFLDTSSQNRYFRPTRGAWAGAWAKRGEARNRKLRLAMLCNVLTFLWFLQKRTLPTCVLVIGLRYKPATGQLV